MRLSCWSVLCYSATAAGPWLQNVFDEWIAQEANRSKTRAYTTSTTTTATTTAFDLRSLRPTHAEVEREALRALLGDVLKHEPMLLAVSGAVEKAGGLNVDLEGRLLAEVPSLQRFSNFYDDLMVLGSRLNDRQYIAAMEYAERELVKESARMSK